MSNNRCRFSLLFVSFAFFKENPWMVSSPASTVLTPPLTNMDGRINLLFWRQTEQAVESYYRQVHRLHPIVLLLELEETSTPNPSFLDAISYFPLIYWMQGKISM
ncbi:hypothetical protein COOONC_25779 [Cooperia oncophora]